MLSKLKSPFFNRTKIIATLGPASSDEDMLTRIIAAGVDICRLNFSHGKHEDIDKIITTVRNINKKYNLHICILCDLQGPKLRIGEMENGSAIWKHGDKVVFTTEKCMGTASKVYMTYHQFPMDVTPGEKILVDDGKLELIVKSTNKRDEVIAEVNYGG